MESFVNQTSLSLKLNPSRDKCFQAMNDTRSQEMEKQTLEMTTVFHTICYYFV